MANFEDLLGKTDRFIRIDPIFMPAIIKGNKTQTRHFELTNYQDGELVHVQSTGLLISKYECPAVLRIIHLDYDETPWSHFWSAMTDEWAVAEGFENRDAFFDHMKEANQTRDINGETWLFMTAFELMAVNPKWIKDNPK